MVHDAALLNTQYYKVRIKGKVEQSREWSNALPISLDVVAIEKGAFESLLINVANFIYIYIYIYTRCFRKITGLVSQAIYFNSK